MKPKLKLLTEMPWATNVTCTDCGFKFGIDAEIESWTPEREINQKHLKNFLKVHKLPLSCPKCGTDIIHDFQHHKTYKYDKIINKLEPSIQKFFKQAKTLIKPEIGRNVIPEHKEVETHLKFETFVKIQEQEEI